MALTMFEAGPRNLSCFIQVVAGRACIPLVLTNILTHNQVTQSIVYHEVTAAPTTNDILS